jgi:NAD(P)-dependent dehydrogenase (short-subunit alcohol dehydrogenase family)
MRKPLGELGIWFNASIFRLLRSTRVIYDIVCAAREIIEAGHEAKAYVVDVTNRERVNEVAEAIRAEFGPVDILINNVCVRVLVFGLRAWQHCTAEWLYHSALDSAVRSLLSRGNTLPCLACHTHATL